MDIWQKTLCWFLFIWVTQTTIYDETSQIKNVTSSYKHVSSIKKTKKKTPWLYLKQTIRCHKGQRRGTQHFVREDLKRAPALEKNNVRTKTGQNKSCMLFFFFFLLKYFELISLSDCRHLELWCLMINQEIVNKRDILWTSALNTMCHSVLFSCYIIDR